MGFQTCPVCHTIIDGHNAFNGVSVCPSCGHTISNKDNQRTTQEFITNSVGFFIMSALLVFSLFAIKKWDTFLMDALPLQAKSVVGSASDADLFKLIDICEERKNLSCVEKYAVQLMKQAPKNTAVINRLAHNFYLHKEYEKAFQTYKAYEELQGEDPNAYYELGKLHVQYGEVDEALRAFEKAIDAKPGVLQITVLESYVRALITSGNKRKAFKTIEFVQKNSRKSTQFMKTEFNKLKTSIERSGKRARKVTKRVKKSPRRLAKVLPQKKSS